MKIPPATRVSPPNLRRWTQPMHARQTWRPRDLDPRSTCDSGGLLDYPHYTRPPEFRGAEVPAVLSSGNHEEIRRWRRRQSLSKTLQNRPDLLVDAPLTEEDRALLDELRHET